jgi:peptidoglycan/xylan/chitin deacetylase (PgdA/CDA1 family)
VDRPRRRADRPLARRAPDPGHLLQLGPTRPDRPDGAVGPRPRRDAPELFSVGDGSWNETDLTGITTAGVVDRSAGRRPPSDRRRDDAKATLPPTGRRRQRRGRAAAAAAGFPYTILWDVDPDDLTPGSSGGPTVDDIVTAVAGRAQPGSIIRLHLGGESTLAALPGILDALGGAGLQPVTLRTMLGL